MEARTTHSPKKSRPRGPPGRGLVHLLLISAAGLGFAWDGDEKGWVRVSFPFLGMMSVTTFSSLLGLFFLVSKRTIFSFSGCSGVDVSHWEGQTSWAW